MKRFFLSLLLAPAWVVAEMPDPERSDDEYRAPTVAEVELLGVRETPPYGSDRPFEAQVRNASAYYLDRVAIRCTVSDGNGRRVFRSLVFRSDPMLSIDFAIPPIKTPELGIAPGAVAWVGLYTNDNRWTRGDGKYRYECEMYGVSGRE